MKVLNQKISNETKVNQDYLIKFFLGKGSVAIKFVKYLLNKYLTDFRKNTCLVFLRNGATPLEKLARELTPHSTKNKIKGLLIQTSYIKERQNHPNIIKTLLLEGILDYDQIVFIDTGYYGTIGRILTDLLEDERLLRYTEEEFNIEIPKRKWKVNIELLCLRNKESYIPRYNIEGFNYVSGKPKDEIYELVAYLIEEGLKQKIAANNIKEQSNRELITQALIQAARGITI